MRKWEYENTGLIVIFKELVIKKIRIIKYLTWPWAISFPKFRIAYSKIQILEKLLDANRTIIERIYLCVKGPHTLWANKPTNNVQELWPEAFLYIGLNNLNKSKKKYGKIIEYTNLPQKWETRAIAIYLLSARVWILHTQIRCI